MCSFGSAVDKVTGYRLKQYTLLHALLSPLATVVFFTCPWSFTVRDNLLHKTCAIERVINVPIHDVRYRPIDHVVYHSEPLHCAHTVYFCVSYDYRSKQRLFP